MSQPIENKSKWATRLIEESGIKRYIDSPLHSDFNKPKPDFTCSINEYGIVIAYKKDVKRQLKLNRGKVSMTETNTLGYAVNKACKCAENILRSKNCPVRRIFAIGISGDEDNHLIDSVLVRKGMLAENGEEPPIVIGRPRKVEDLQDFSPQYISDSLIYSVNTEEKYAPEHYARTFRNEIRSYTNFTENEILLTGTGMLLAALGARNVKGGHRPLPDSEEGKKILFNWLKAALKLPKAENFIYYFFEILKAPVLHEGTPRLPKHSTPAQHLMEFLEKDVIPLEEVNKDSIKTFYMAFKRLMERRSPLASTPEFVTSLFYDILEITSSDRVLDALCGGGDLMTAIAERMEQSGEDSCRDHQVMGMENPAGLQMAGIAEATFKLNRTEDLCKVLEGSLNDFQGKANIGILCPSYEVVHSEVAFNNLEATKELLDKIEPGGKVLCVLPQSSLTTRNGQDLQIKKDILAQNTLEGVITLERRIGIFPCLAIFTAGIPQPAKKKSKFISCSLENESYETVGRDGIRVRLRPSASRAEFEDEKRKEIIDLWRSKGNLDAKHFIEVEPKPEEEWLHSFYYFNTDVPTEEDFEKTVGDYLSFQFSMIMQGRGYLFDN